jgi:hypothetical protein
VKDGDRVTIDGLEYTWHLTGRDQPWCCGFFGDDGLWHEELHHADGRVERFVSSGPGMARVEDNS